MALWVFLGLIRVQDEDSSYLENLDYSIFMKNKIYNITIMLFNYLFIPISKQTLWLGKHQQYF